MDRLAPADVVDAIGAVGHVRAVPEHPKVASVVGDYTRRPPPPKETRPWPRPTPRDAPFLDPGSATIEDFGRLDLRIGRIVDARPLDGARVPAYRLRIDFGPAGARDSSARLTRTYPDPAPLVGRLVVAVVNFAPRRVAGFASEVLVLGAIGADGDVPLLGVDAGAEPGMRVG